MNLRIVATKRKYQSIRRQWLAEGKEGYEEQTEKEGYTKKKRTRRQRVYSFPQYITACYFVHKLKNSGFCTWWKWLHYIMLLFILYFRNFITGNLWCWKRKPDFGKDLSIYYMTEESDCASDDNIVIEHKIPWRSQGCKLCIHVVWLYVTILHDILG